MQRATSCVLLVLVLFSGCSERPQNAGGGGEKIDHTADEFVYKMADFLEASDAFAFKLQAKFQVGEQSLDSEYQILIDRPGRIAAKLQGEGQLGGSVYHDGQKTAIYYPSSNTYQTFESTGNTEQLIAQLMMTGNLSGFALLLIQDDIGEALLDGMLEGVTDAEYLGSDELEGLPCHHCRFSGEGAKWDVWIEEGEQPLPRRFAVSFSPPGGGGSIPSLSMQMDFTEWNRQPTVSDEEFVFDPPAGAEEGESPVAALMAQLLGSAQPAHSLQGKAAPPFTAKNLQGESVSLADHLGQDVVVLDFWATWCTPCVLGLPILSEVTSEYADQGVVFYAVNQQEDVATINEFLESENMQLPVLLDEGEISAKYDVEGIPQTVIIGRDGEVAIVHVGVPRDLKMYERQLKGELDALLR